MEDRSRTSIDLVAEKGIGRHSYRFISFVDGPRCLIQTQGQYLVGVACLRELSLQLAPDYFTLRLLKVTSMTRSAKSLGPRSIQESSTSGLRRKWMSERPPGEILDGEGLVELWQLVDFWVTQIVPGDPRRRLLELAKLRHDTQLAAAVLRYL